MAPRNVTITTTVTKTAGQILYEAADAPADGLGALPPWHDVPAEDRARFERMADALIKALDAERAASVPHVRLTPLTHDPQQPLPVWPGVFPYVPQDGPRPGEFWWEVTCDAPKGPSLASDSTAPVSLIAPQHGVTLDGKR